MRRTAIRFPSGDHAGAWPSRITTLTELLFRSMTLIRSWRSSKAIFVPSGDQAGRQ
jgi:hypothetical protein